MAAGAYKGLTIQIGADTTKLASALRGADSAIFKTQKQLNNLAKAAKLDPGNKQIQNLQLGALSNQATNVAREIALLQTGIDELGDKKVLKENGEESVKTIKELADETENVALKAIDVKDAYNEVNDELKDLYAQIKKENPDVELAKLREITNSGKFDESVLRNLVKENHITQEQADRVMALKERWVAARSALTNYSNVSELANMNSKLVQQDSNLKNIVATMRNMDKESKLKSTSTTDQSMTEINGRLALITAASATATARLNELNQAARLDPSNFDIASQRAEALAEAIQVAEEKSVLLKEKLATLKDSDAAKAGDDIKNVTVNLEEAKQKFDQAHDNVTKIEQALIKAGGAAEVTAASIKEVGDSDDGFEETAKSAEELESELQEAERKVSELVLQMRNLNQSGSEASKAVEGIGKADSGVDEVTKSADELERELHEAEQQVAKLEKKLDAAREAASKMSESVAEVDDAASEVNEANEEIEELKQKLDEAREAEDKAFKEFDTAKTRSEIRATRDELTKNNQVIEQLKNSFGGLQIKSGISDSLKPLEQQLKVIEAGITNAQSKFNLLNQAAQIRPHNLSLAVERVRALKDATDAARQQTDILKQKLDSYKASGIDKLARDMKYTSVSFQQAQQEVNRLNQELETTKMEEGESSQKAKELQAALDAARKAADTEAAVKEYRELSAQLEKVKSDSRSMVQSMKADLGQVGAAAVQAAQQVGQLMQQAWSSVSQASNDVDSSYRNLRKTFNATEDDYQKLYDAAMQYSQSHVTSADTMLEMEATAAQLGVGIEGGAEAIQKFADAAANLDVATDISADQIALQMGQIMNVMNDVSTDNIDKFADALVRLGNNMPTQESNIMQITQRLAAVGDVAGFTTPELMGWAAAIASTGQKSEAAATGVATTITTIQKAVSAGGDDLEKFAKVAGVSAEEFASKWKKEPTKALQDFLKGLQNLGDKEFAELENLGISGVRQTQTLTALAQTVGKVGDSIRMAKDAFNGVDDEFGKAGDAAREAERKSEGFSGSLAKMNNSAQVLAASLGPSIAPILDDVASKLQWLTGVVDSMSDKTKTKILKAATAFMAFSAAYPIVSALGSNLKSFASGVMSFFVNAIAKAIVNMQYLTSSAFTLGEKLVFLTGSAERASAIEKLATGLKTLATSGALAAGALGAVALFLAGTFIVNAYNAKKHADDFNGALLGMKKNVEGIGKDFLVGSNGFSGFSSALYDAKTEMDNLISSLQEHNNRNAETRKSTSESIGLLSEYKRIVDECAGAEEVSAEKKAELEWALKGLEEATGQAFDAEQVLTGEYQNEAGEVMNVKNAIDQLIQSKITEAKINAAQEMYTDTLKEQMKAQEKLAEAEAAYNKRRDNYLKANEGYRDLISGRILSEEELIEKMNREDGEARNLKQAYDEASRAVDSLTQESEKYKKMMGQYQKESMDIWGDREGIMQTTEAMRDALTALNYTDEEIKKLAESIEDAGVTEEQFAQISGETFAKLAQQSGGDMQTLTDMIVAYNNLPIETKQAIVRYDGEEMVLANGDRLVWNGSEFVTKTAKAEADTSSLPAATQNIDNYNSSSGQMRDTSATATAYGNAATSDTPAKNVASLNTAGGNMTDVYATYTARGNAADGSAAANVWNLVEAGRNMVSKTIDLTTNVIKNVIEKHSATGAYIPYNKIPKHASGIFTRPTLTNIGWVGEDGAELYSGNSLVPLTNRKYSMPYINDISDAVAKKLGGLGTVNNFYINDAVVNGDAEIEAAFLALFDTLARKGALNVG